MPINTSITTPLGHITMVPKGAYSSSAIYNRLDLVTEKDEEEKTIGLYIAKKDNFTNIPFDNDEYWMKIIETSDMQGPPGQDGQDGQNGTDGVGIASIEGPTNSPNHQPGGLDNYTIHFTNNTLNDFAFSVRNGNNGEQGIAATLGEPEIISVDTLEYDQDATVSVTCSEGNTNKVFGFSFGIPRGEPGNIENVNWNSIGGSPLDNSNLSEIIDSITTDLATKPSLTNGELTGITISGSIITSTTISGGTILNATANTPTTGAAENSIATIKFVNDAIATSGGGSGSATLSNPLSFTYNGDVMELGLYPSQNESNIWLKGFESESENGSVPAIYVAQYTKQAQQQGLPTTLLTLLDTSGQTIIPSLKVTATTQLDQPLDIAYGGTGLTAAPSMLTNLSSTTAASPLTANPGVTGTLGVANGGTSATTAGINLLENLGIHIVNNEPAVGDAIDGHIYLVCESE